MPTCQVSFCDRKTRTRKARYCEGHRVQAKRRVPFTALPKREEEPDQRRSCRGCLLPFREKPWPRIPNTKVEFNDGLCQTCYRDGPAEVPHDMALWAVEQARIDRYLADHPDAG